MKLFDFRKEIVRLLVVCVLPMSLTARMSAFSPNTNDLDTAISSGDFNGYFTSISLWLSQQLPSDTARISQNTLKHALSDPVFANTLAQRQLLFQTGVESMGHFAKASQENRAFLKWILKDTKAMELYLEGGAPSGNRPIAVFPPQEGNPAESLSIWGKIFSRDPDSKEGTCLKLAIATGLACAVPNNTLGTTEPIEPFSRYNHFKSAYRNNELFPIFNNLSVWEYRMVLNASDNVAASDSDLAWAREMIATFRPDLRTQDKVSHVGGLLEYKEPEEAHNYRELVRVGGMCGAISFTGAMACQAFGMPALIMGQPEHCAFAYEIAPGIWNIGNDISGWDQSQYCGIPMSYFRLEAEARLNQASFSQVQHLKWLAETLASADQAKAVLKTALKINPLDFSLWQELVSRMKSDTGTTSAEWTSLFTDVSTAFFNYPDQLADMLDSIRDAAVLSKIDKRVLTQFAQNVAMKISDGLHASNLVPLWRMYYALKPVVDIEIDLLLPSQLTATDTSHEGGETGANTVDGVMEGLWSTRYDLSQPLPQSVTITFDKIYDINKVVYWPRTGGGNGNITAYNLYLSNDGKEFYRVASGTWKPDESGKPVTFPHANALCVKLEAVSGEGGWATASEIQVFKYRATPLPSPKPVPTAPPALSQKSAPPPLPPPAQIAEAPIAAIPGVLHYEVESCVTNSGVRFLNCATGGQQANIKTGDWMDYTIDVPTTGVYGIEMRIATPYSGGAVEVIGKTNTLAVIALPNTTGLWKTTPATDITLNQGAQTLRISAAKTRECAIRWFRLVSPGTPAGHTHGDDHSE